MARDLFREGDENELTNSKMLCHGIAEGIHGWQPSNTRAWMVATATQDQQIQQGGSIFNQSKNNRKGEGEVGEAKICDQLNGLS